MRKTSLYLSIVILNLFSTSIWSAVTVLDPSQRRVDQPAPTPPNPIVVDNAKRLLADNWVVENMSELNRTLHPVMKHPQNPIFKPEKPWEKPAVLLFGTVMYDPQRDEDKFRMWYLCFTPQFSEDFSQRKNKNGCIAYAISRDGIHWKRPNLGIHDYEGSKDNNIVITGAPDSNSIIHDPLDPDLNRRYKAHVRNAGRHLAYFSPDGIHWTKHGRINIDGNDRSTVHWDPLRRHWFATTKSNYKTASGDIRRGRGYQESQDFLHWGPVSFLCATPETAPDFVYNLEPFYYESMFLGIWGRYTAEPDALLDIQLAVSHNGRHWERPSHEPWIPLAPLPKDFQREKKPYITPVTGVDPSDPSVPWDYGNNSGSALGPVRVGDQLWMYYSGRKTDHRSKPHIGAIGLGTLRLDGFFSLDAGETEGTLLTRPLRLVHKNLHVNANVAGGQLYVEIVDLSGKPIPPFTRKNCVPVTTDSVRHQIQWRGTDDLSPVLEKTVRLRFTMKKTEIYAFWTGQEHRWHTPDTTVWKWAR